MAWTIHFIPNEADAVAVNIDNQYWTTWYKTQGEQNWTLPVQWVNAQQLKVYAAAQPRGRNASIEVMWGERLVQRMDFDNDEDHDLDQPAVSIEKR